MAATVTGAHHVSFPVKDLARARAFYEGVLGLQQKPRPDFPFPGVWYQAGACEVHLIETPSGFDAGTQPPVLNPLAGHTAFGIDDYATMVAQVKARGVEILEAGPDQGQAWVRDPDGHIIELIVVR
jgi:glyoxylase I family protein